MAGMNAVAVMHPIVVVAGRPRLFAPTRVCISLPATGWRMRGDHRAPRRAAVAAGERSAYAVHTYLLGAAVVSVLLQESQLPIWVLMPSGCRADRSELHQNTSPSRIRDCKHLKKFCCGIYTTMELCIRVLMPTYVIPRPLCSLAGEAERSEVF